MSHRHRLAILLVVAAVAGVVAFAMVEARAGGWPEMHPHSGSVEGTPVIQALPPQEAAFYRALWLLVPALVALGLALPGAAVDRAGRHWRSVSLAAAVIAFAGAWSVGHLALERTPITDDEQAYLFHARVAASGRLAAEPPEGAPYFENIFLVLDKGRWFSQYPVGNALVLAPGVLAGDPWLVPPLLAALTVLLLAATARELFGATAAAATAVAAASSPFLSAISGTLLAHTACLFFLALFLWAGVVGSAPGRSRAWVVLCAVAFGLAVYVRPSSAVVAGVPLFGLLWVRSAELPDRWPRRLLFAATGALMVGGQLLLNATTSGHPLVSGYVAYWVPRVGLRSPFGFGAFPWGVHHTPATAVGNLIHNLIRLDAWLLGHALSLALPVVAVVRGHALGRARWWLGGAGVIPFVVYFFYFWPGISDVGPVLYAETMVVWLILAGAAVAVEPPRLARLAAGVIVAGAILAPTTFLRLQWPVLATIADASRAPLRAVAELPPDERAIVFCQTYLRPGKQGSWMAGRPNPWPDLRDRVLFVRSRGERSDRHFWSRFQSDRRPYYLVFDGQDAFHLVPMPAE